MRDQWRGRRVLITGGMGFLGEACRQESPLTKVLHVSTRQVYGRVTVIPVTEAAVVRPIDINGIHERAAEQSLRLRDAL